MLYWPLEYYDKYFIRNISRESLNVAVIDSGRKVFISAVGAGGNGIIFNFSLGAENELTEVVANSVRRMEL